MKTITVSISENEFQNFGFKSDSIAFKELLEKISTELARKALARCHQIAKETGLSEMTLDEINAEIKEVRKNAKNRH
jgi:Glu-tRNA(Gln) amidotransferase subunit E-like FAD-binding protein